MLFTTFITVAVMVLAAFTEANFSPASREINPVGVYAQTGNVTVDSAGENYRLRGPNATITFDFGQMVAGIVTIAYVSYTCVDCSIPNRPSFSCDGACVALGVAFTENPAFVGAASDRTAYFTHPDGTLYVPLETVPYTLPSEFLRGSFRYLTLSVIGEGASGLILDMEIPSLYFTAAPERPDNALGDYTGNFTCSDSSLEHIWNAGVYTAQLCTISPNTSVDHGFIGKPVGWASNASAVGLATDDVILVDGAKRDRNPWSGDVSVSLRTALVSQNYNNLASIRNVLQECMILQDNTTGFFPYAGSPLGSLLSYISDTYSLWTIVGFADYVLSSNDLDFGAQHWTRAVRGIEATYPYIDNATGLYNGTRNSDWGRIGQGGQNIALNAIYYQSFQSMGRVASLLNKTTDSDIGRWTARAAEIKTSANNVLFDSDFGLYWDNSTAAGHMLHPTDGNALAVIFNLTNSSDQTASISKALASRLTKYGVTLPESPTVISPFISSLVLRAHFVATPWDSAAAMDLIRTQWSYMLQTFSNTTTIEAYNTTGDLSYAFYDGGGPFISHAHGWSTGPTYSLLTNVVGLRTVPGLDVSYEEGDWAFQPASNGSGLTYAQGGFTTHYGDFAASWNTTGTLFQAQLSTPVGTRGTIYIPAEESSVYILTLDGKETAMPQIINGYAVIASIKGGSHVMSLLQHEAVSTGTAGSNRNPGTIGSFWLFLMTFAYLF